MLKVWGRRNSVNVQKVLWCCGELGVEFERIDAGLRFGVNDQPGYLAMNPNGRIPTIEDGDFRLWESNAILRYLALQHGEGSGLYPGRPRANACVNRWLDWTISTLLPAELPVFLGYVRTPPEDRDEALLKAQTATAIEVWRIADAHLRGRPFMEDGRFTIADIALGCFARRWFRNTAIQRPPMPDLERWYAGLEGRRAFQDHLGGPLS